jgi:hypothetical protein
MSREAFGSNRQLLACLGHIACTEHATKIHMAAVENPEGLFMFCRSIYQNFFYISSGLYLYNAIFADIHIGLAFQIARNLFRERERERFIQDLDAIFFVDTRLIH